MGPTLPAMFANHADPALEAMLPTSVSGTALSSYSLTLTQILDAGSADRRGIDSFLQAIGKTEADGSFAAALDPTGAVGGGVEAFKITGADTAALLAGITSIEASDLGAGATTTQTTVGNKSVTMVSVGSGVNDTEWIYGHDDVVFVVQADNADLAAAYLTPLP